MYRTHTCGVVNESLSGQTITLCGWTRHCRHHGGIIFIDLCDRIDLQGLETQVQIVCHPDTPAIFEQAEQLRSEYVIQVRGEVRMRPQGTENKSLFSGQVEIIAHHLTILNKAVSLPFELGITPNEETALRFRYLHLRHPLQQARFQLRSQMNSLIRRTLESKGFWEVETPLLTRATPEGARDYLVPSRTYPQHYFALPQSPQLFKQMLMVAGFDRYYQIARCFRDEDLRADRQPEFTQLDLEMAFVEEHDVQLIAEELLRQLFQELLQVQLPNPFPKLSYQEVLRDYGTDKPDLRNPLKLVDIADLVQSSTFSAFSNAACDSKARVAAIKLPGGASISRRTLEEYTHYVTQKGAQGLAWLKITETGMQSPLTKHLSQAILNQIVKRTTAVQGDILFFGAGQASIVNTTLGALRTHLGNLHQLIKTPWSPVWIIDFPLLEWDELSQRWQSLHHPFTAPKNLENKEVLSKNPNEYLARAYDLVLNGTELGGGSIRIHNADLQLRMFQLLQIDRAEAQEKFGFLLEALQSGCPPHGGIALGLDRLIMLMCGAQSIREVIAFPKTQTVHCLLTGAPSRVTREQLQVLHLPTR